MSLPFYNRDSHWREFYPDPRDAKYLENHVREIWIPSLDTKIHVDVYENKEDAPVVIYLHGMSTNGRIMGHLVRPLYERGYTVLCPDLVGFGMTLRKKGSGTIPEFVQNALDTIAYAKKRYKTPRFLTGISLGGILSYYAAAAGADVKAIASFCLTDLSTSDTHSISPIGHLTDYIIPLLKKITPWMPNLPFPVNQLLHLDGLTDTKEIVDLFKRNAHITKFYTLKSCLSLITEAPSVPFEKFKRLPTLVLHSVNDKMFPEKLSRQCYEKLACPKKYVPLMESGHVPFGDKEIIPYIDEVDAWFKKYLK